MEIKITKTLQFYKLKTLKLLNDKMLNPIQHIINVIVK